MADETKDVLGSPSKQQPPAELKKEFALNLKPTQFALGVAVLTEKVDEITKKYQEGPEAFDEYLKSKAVPVVVGPWRAAGNPNAFFMIDHHHFVWALLNNPTVPDTEKQVYIRVVKDLSTYGTDHFWTTMAASNWCNLNRLGKGPINAQELPADIRGMVDDPYRSLAWAVRKRTKAFQKSQQPFAEFKWADYLRDHTEFNQKLKELGKSKLQGSEFDPAVVEAAADACKQQAARSLPGYVGDPVKYPLRTPQKAPGSPSGARTPTREGRSGSVSPIPFKLSDKTPEKFGKHTAAEHPSAAKFLSPQVQTGVAPSSAARGRLGSREADDSGFAARVGASGGKAGAQGRVKLKGKGHTLRRAGDSLKRGQFSAVVSPSTASSGNASAGVTSGNASSVAGSAVAGSVIGQSSSGSSSLVSPASPSFEKAGKGSAPSAAADDGEWVKEPPCDTLGIDGGCSHCQADQARANGAIDADDDGEGVSAALLVKGYKRSAADSESGSTGKGWIGTAMPLFHTVAFTAWALLWIRKKRQGAY